MGSDNLRVEIAGKIRPLTGSLVMVVVAEKDEHGGVNPLGYEYMERDDPRLEGYVHDPETEGAVKKWALDNLDKHIEKAMKSNPKSKKKS